jgi:signal transduction histidine kinase
MVVNSTIEHLQRRVDALSRLVEVSVRLNSTLETDKVLTFIIEVAAELLDAEAASIMLVDERTRELRFAAATGADPKQLAEIPVPLDSSIAGTIFREARPEIVLDVRRDPRHYPDVGQAVRLEVRSLVAVPMRIQDRVVGVLEALNRQHGAFSEADVEILSILAAHSAVAIQNARLLTEVRRANAELADLDRKKSTFIALASHELRTPLGIILGYADMLREQNLKGEVAEYARNLLSSAARMRAIVDDLTNLRYLEMGELPVDRVRTDLRELLTDAHVEMAQLAAASSQSFDLELPAKPLLVEVDRRGMMLVLSNLLGNAIRFTPNGGAIRLSAFEKGGEAWIEVHDNGVGIPAGHEEAIFERFYQVQDHMRRDRGGMGIGLSIVRAQVQAQGGRTWAQSAGPGKGSVFTVVLPLISEREG